MSFFAEDSGVVLTQAALIFTILRWILTLLFRFINSDNNDDDDVTRCHLPSAQAIRENLPLSTFGDIATRMLPPLSQVSDTCAVCLSNMDDDDEVRELRNCCHVFHKECIDRWLDYDHENHKTCPLCRAPMMTSSQSVGWARSEPSWAVERLLYLFGDDLQM